MERLMIAEHAPLFKKSIALGHRAIRWNWSLKFPPVYLCKDCGMRGDESMIGEVFVETCVLVDAEDGPAAHRPYRSEYVENPEAKSDKEKFTKKREGR